MDTTAAWTDQWAEAEPHNVDAVLVRSRSFITRGWAVRGGAFARYVGGDAFAEFHRLLHLAQPLCDEAARLAPDDPTPWAQRVLLATALGESRTSMEQCWAEVVARDPFHREAHGFKLMYLCLKWRGSHEEMFAFAQDAASAAPHGSPLRVLPVHARAEWVRAENIRDSSPANTLKLTTLLRDDAGVRAELDQALDGWFATAPRKHAMWYDDLNYLAYGLVQSNRYTDAKAVFEAIGPYREFLPWAWIGEDAESAFRAERTKASLRS